MAAISFLRNIIILYAVFGLIIDAQATDQCAETPYIQLIGCNTDCGRVIVLDQNKDKWYPICFESIPKKQEFGQKVCELVGFPKLSSFQPVGLKLAHFDKRDECIRLNDAQNIECFESMHQLSNCFESNKLSVSKISDSAVYDISCQATTMNAFQLPDSTSMSMIFMNLFNKEVLKISDAHSSDDFDGSEWLKLNVSDIKSAYIYSTGFLEEINVLNEEILDDDSANYDYNMIGINVHSKAVNPNINYANADDVKRAIFNEFDDRIRAFQMQNFLKSANNKQRIHALYHWMLDSQLRTKSYFEWAMANIIPADDQIARNLYKTLHHDGIAMFDDFGFSLSDLDLLLHIFSDTISQNDVSKFSSTSNGSVITVRRKNELLETYLSAGNSSIMNAIKAYLGSDVLLNGYKITKLSSELQGSKDYIAGYWHHDRVGRRLKLFIFLNDVDCNEGRPTLVAKGTNLLEYWKSDTFYSSRFRDEYVSNAYDVVRGCGKKGGGFLFDTHSIHRAGVELKGKENTVDRLTVIAEYHNIIKCHLNEQFKLGLPCPSGDQYIVNVSL